MNEEKDIQEVLELGKVYREAIKEYNELNRNLRKALIEVKELQKNLPIIKKDPHIKKFFHVWARHIMLPPRF